SEPDDEVPGGAGEVAPRLHSSQGAQPDPRDDAGDAQGDHHLDESEPCWPALAGHRTGERPQNACPLERPLRDQGSAATARGFASIIRGYFLRIGYLMP